MSAERRDAARHPVVRFVRVVVIAAVALMFVCGVIMCAAGVWSLRFLFHEFTYRSGLAYLLYVFIKMYYDVEELKNRQSCEK